MITGLWNSARANKENILYTVLTIFLLERVRRGWNRIEEKGRALNQSATDIERRQQSFTFRAALMYALLFLLPAVKYVYRSFDELAQYVNGLVVLDSLWAFFGILLVSEFLIAVVIYNLLGIYVERMNGALGFFRNLGRSVVDGSKVVMHTVSIDAPVRLYGSVQRRARSATSTVAASTRSVVSWSADRCKHMLGGITLRMNRRGWLPDRSNSDVL